VSGTPSLSPAARGLLALTFVLHWIKNADTVVVNLDLLTYAENPKNLAALEGDTRHQLVRGDICNAELVGCIVARAPASAIVHFAAESHVDRSIIRSRRFYSHQRTGDLHALEQARIFGRSWTRPVGDLPLPTRLSPTRSMDPSAGPDPAFCESMPMRPTAPMRHRRRPPIIWRGRTTAPMDCPCSLQTARINYGPFQFP